MTKRQYFAEIKKLVEVAEIAEDTRADYISFIDKEVELLNRKSSRSENSKAAKEAKERMEVVKTALAEMGTKARVSEIVAHINRSDYSPNRVTAILGKMAGTKTAEGTGEVIRVVEKGVAYFSLAE